jgi:predicted ATPase/class 3 adenylate cyclase
VSEFPTGTVTLIFTDIEGSTRLLQSVGEKYGELLSLQREILREVFLGRQGVGVDTQGDAFFYAFPRARDAVLAAVEAQDAIAGQEWPAGAEVRIRMGLHTGESLELGREGYVGMDVHRAARIAHAGHGGQILLSASTAAIIKPDLADDLLLLDLGEHRLKDLRHPLHLFQIQSKRQPSKFPPLRSLDQALNNLPHQLTTFIGRGREITEVEEMVISNRLVTLTGAGGCGKTRLALRVAENLTGEFEDGAWLVKLDALADASLVPQAVATIFGVQESPGWSLIDLLSENIKHRNVLMVLDNCEQVVAACAHLAETLLQKCPGLKILCTSREALGVAGEIVWTVPPLSLPEEGPDENPLPVYEGQGVSGQSEAVQLFVDRAASMLPEFTLTNENVASIADICRRLDGIALAIELAAARVRTLSAQQIAQRLDDRFHLLVGGSRTAEPRQQTLAATLDWSYALLSEPERKVFQRLSSFSGGCTLEAAEAICAGKGVHSAEVLDLLSQLVEKSLVVVDQPIEGDTRYRLIETIRRYAGEKSLESGEADDTRDRHLGYFIEWTEMALPHLTRPDQFVWINRMEAEHDNIRAALEWSQIVAGGAEAGLRLASALGPFWKLRSYYTEGRRRLSAVLAREGAEERTVLRARVLHHASSLAFFQSDYSATRTLAEEGLAIARENGDPGRLEAANALEILAEVALETGDYSTPTRLFEEALAIYREIGDLAGIGDTLKMLGWGAMRTGDYELAEGFLDEGLIFCRRSGDVRQITSALAGLGELALRRGKLQRADEFLRESLALSRRSGEKWSIAIVLGSLGWIALRGQDYGEMRSLLGESLEVRMETGDRGGIAWCLEKLGEANYEQSHFQQSAMIFGAASALRASVGSSIDATDRPDYERTIRGLQTAIGDQAFQVAWEAGVALTLEQAVDLALTELDSI